MKNKDSLRTDKEERSKLHIIKRRKAKLIGLVLSRKCLVRHVIGGQIEDTRDGRTRKKMWAPTYDLKEKRRYWILEEEALDRTLWTIRCGSGCGLVVRQNTQ